MLRYYCVIAKSKMEFEAEKTIAELGFSVFLPKEAVYNDIWYVEFNKKTGAYIKKRETTRTLKSYFYNYLFVELDLTNDNWKQISNLKSVYMIYGPPESPIPLKSDAIEGIKSLGKAADGAIDHRFFSPKINLIEPGKKAVILGGPLENNIGICISSTEDRSRLLVSLFDRNIEVNISSDQLKEVT